MNHEARVALEACITKYAGILRGDEYRLDVSECPLCKLYWWGANCVGCPVMKRTGRDRCKGTPYILLHKLAHNLSPYTRVIQLGRRGMWLRNLLLRWAVWRELRFLKSLREKPEEPATL